MDENGEVLTSHISNSIIPQSEGSEIKLIKTLPAENIQTSLWQQITVRNIDLTNTEERQIVLKSLLRENEGIKKRNNITESQVNINIEELKKYIIDLSKHGLVKIITHYNEQTKQQEYVGAILIGQEEDETGKDEMTLSYGRYPGGVVNSGAMTIAMIKVCEELISTKYKIKNREERTKLRTSTDEQDQNRLSREKSTFDNLQFELPLRAYVKPDNIKSQNLILRVGFKNTNEGALVSKGLHEGYLRYELDLDTFDKAWDEQEKWLGQQKQPSVPFIKAA
jgi:hypothetical protein